MIHLSEICGQDKNEFINFAAGLVKISGMENYGTHNKLFLIVLKMTVTTKATILVFAVQS
jgi:hypothetical protein